jgi:hypothetical protein
MSCSGTSLGVTTYSDKSIESFRQSLAICSRAVLSERQPPLSAQVRDLIVQVVKPAPRAGRFLGYVGDEFILHSRQPFLDGARALLTRGYDPATPYNMRHANSETLSFVTTTIGHAAGLSVNDARTAALPEIHTV